MNLLLSLLLYFRPEHTADGERVGGAGLCADPGVGGRLELGGGEIRRQEALCLQGHTRRGGRDTAEREAFQETRYVDSYNSLYK